MGESITGKRRYNGLKCLTQFWKWWPDNSMTSNAKLNSETFSGFRLISGPIEFGIQSPLSVKATFREDDLSGTWISVEGYFA